MDDIYESRHTGAEIDDAVERAKSGGEIDSILNAAEYSAAQTYALGDYCTHDGKLYRCTTAITEAENWTAEHWAETSVSAELKAIYMTLQKKVDGGKKSAWVTDASAFSRNGVSYCRDDAGTVYVTIYNTRLTEEVGTWTSAVICTLPEGFRPTRNISVPLNHSYNKCSNIFISTNGQILISTAGESVNTSADISFFISFPTA